MFSKHCSGVCFRKKRKKKKVLCSYVIHVFSTITIHKPLFYLICYLKEATFPAKYNKWDNSHTDSSLTLLPRPDLSDTLQFLQQSPSEKGKWNNKTATSCHWHFSISFTSFIYFISFSLLFLPQCALCSNKFCYFKVTEWITFVLFKVALRNRVKLDLLEQALLFKSKRCSNVLAILSHSCFPHGASGWVARYSHS